MNRATRPALFSSKAHPFGLRASLFHSTPVLDRRRRTYWDGGGGNRDSSKRSNYYSRRSQRLHLKKQSLLHDVSAFAEHLFQSWQKGYDEHDPSSSQGSPWFRHEYGDKTPKEGGTGSKGPKSSRRRGFHFCIDDIDVETMYHHSGFGGNGYYYWSFVDHPGRRSSSGRSKTFRSSWNWRHQDEEDDDSSTESDSLESDLASDRRALGLTASGPLKLEDVKNAYRTCALKWHPDRHQGTSKAVAEEKFKTCSLAYQSLCDRLA